MQITNATTHQPATTPTTPLTEQAHDEPADDAHADVPAQCDWEIVSADPQDEPDHAQEPQEPQVAQDAQCAREADHDDAMCTVCLEALVEARVLQCLACGVRFHQECLEGWNQATPQAACPTCRAPMEVTLVSQSRGGDPPLGDVWEQQGVQQVPQVQNPLIEFTESVDHPCTLNGQPAILKGKLADRSMQISQGKFVLELTQTGRTVVATEQQIVFDETIPLQPPWADPRGEGVRLLRAPDKSAALKSFLRERHIPGFFRDGDQPVSFMEVFDTYRMYGVCILFFGGAVRQAILESSTLSLKDVDVIYGTSPPFMAAVMAENGLGPVSHPHAGKIQWGRQSARSDPIMEGSPICPNLSSCYSGESGADLGSTECVISNSLRNHVVTLDFSCNSVVYEPTTDTFVDVSGMGVIDTVQQVLRIPVPRNRWLEWAGNNGLKLLRYWKMKLYGFRVADDETHDFILTQTLHTIPKTSKAPVFKFLRGSIMHRKPPEHRVAEQELTRYNQMLTADVEAFCSANPGMQQQGEEFLCCWASHLEDARNPELVLETAGTTSGASRQRTPNIGGRQGQQHTYGSTTGLYGNGFVQSLSSVADDSTPASGFKISFGDWGLQDEPSHDNGVTYSSPQPTGTGHVAYRPRIPVWLEARAPDGRPYWYKEGTQETTWDNPHANQTLLAQPSQAPAVVWTQLNAQDGRPYYHNPQTNETVWELPPGALVSQAMPQQVQMPQQPVVYPAQVVHPGAAAGQYQPPVAWMQHMMPRMMPQMQAPVVYPSPQQQKLVMFNQLFPIVDSHPMFQQCANSGQITGILVDQMGIQEVHELCVTPQALDQKLTEMRDTLFTTLESGEQMVVTPPPPITQEIVDAQFDPDQIEVENFLEDRDEAAIFQAQDEFAHNVADVFTTGRNETDIFQCPNCEKRRCVYFQKQTSSVDEPMPCFIRCVECGHQWKEC